MKEVEFLVGLIEACEEAEWEFRLRPDGVPFLESPVFHNPSAVTKGLRSLAEQLRRKGEASTVLGEIIASKAEGAHTLKHAAADDLLEREGATLRFHPARGIEYHPCGWRSPFELATIACGPGREAMSPQDWGALENCLDRMGYGQEELREMELEVREDIFAHAEKRVRDWMERNGLDDPVLL